MTEWDADCRGWGTRLVWWQYLAWGGLSLAGVLLAIGFIVLGAWGVIQVVAWITRWVP